MENNVNENDTNEISFDTHVKKILRNSKKSFFKSPEIFLKAFLILYFPNIYYYFRA